MNLWTCDTIGCDKACVGIGGAIGLRAIGWYVKLSEIRGDLIPPTLHCPAHHPNQSPCIANDCPICLNVDTLQKMIEQAI